MELDHSASCGGTEGGGDDRPPPQRKLPDGADDTQANGSGAGDSSKNQASIPHTPSLSEIIARSKKLQIGKRELDRILMPPPKDRPPRPLMPPRKASRWEPAPGPQSYTIIHGRSPPEPRKCDSVSFSFLPDALRDLGPSAAIPITIPLDGLVPRSAREAKVQARRLGSGSAAHQSQGPPSHPPSRRCSRYGLVYQRRKDLRRTGLSSCLPPPSLATSKQHSLTVTKRVVFIGPKKDGASGFTVARTRYEDKEDDEPPPPDPFEYFESDQEEEGLQSPSQPRVTKSVAAALVRSGLSDTQMFRRLLPAKTTAVSPGSKMLMEKYAASTIQEAKDGENENEIDIVDGPVASKHDSDDERTEMRE